MRRPITPDSSLPAGRRVALMATILALAVWAAHPATAQSLNDLLGGGDSSLIPAKQTEPKLTITLTPEGSLESGATLRLAIKAEYGADAYTYSQNPSFGGATKINVTEVYGLEAIDEQFTPDHPPKVVFEDAIGQELEKFPGGITWTRRFRFTGTVPADQVYLTGTISYQVCDDRNCRPLREAFEVFVELPAEGVAAPANVADAPSAPEGLPTTDRPANVMDAPPLPEVDRTTAVPQPTTAHPEPSMRAAATAEDMGEVPLEFNLGSKADEASLPWYLGMAFLGGLILNVMPCVLPVLAIKVMSFVQQAGESRGRVLALNISYSLGVIGVFLVLASLAVTLNLGWGGQFQSREFNLAMIGLVFAMGLSLLGVFEIPIPGMVGSAGGQHREGLFGAFLIGVFATLLATPCSGPFMTTALAWSVKQEPKVVYLVWGVMGLGMASPFLAVGTLPALARFIPRPGDWMVRFKEFCGFSMMGAALWLMNSLPSETILPTLIMLLGLGLGLWMVGSMYDHKSTFTRKMTVRFYALLAAGLIGWFGFSKYTEGLAVAEARRLASSALRDGDPVPGDPALAAKHGEGALPWEPFSGQRLLGLLREGKPVLVDFTANWCLICKQNERLALNTEATNEFVRKHGIATLYADYTVYSEEIREWLVRFGADAVPLTVIFKQGDPQNPIILDGAYLEGTLLGHLEEAVAGNVAAESRQSALVDQTSR